MCAFVGVLLKLQNARCNDKERTEKFSWTDRVKNEEVLRGVKEERNILLTVKRRKANSIGHIWRRDCLLKRVTEGKNRRNDRSEGKKRKKA